MDPILYCDGLPLINTFADSHINSQHISNVAQNDV